MIIHEFTGQSGRKWKIEADKKKMCHVIHVGPVPYGQENKSFNIQHDEIEEIVKLVEENKLLRRELRLDNEEMYREFILSRIRSMALGISS